PAPLRGLDHDLNARLIVLVKGFENGGCGNCTFVFLRHLYSVVCTSKLRCPLLCTSCTRMDVPEFPLLSPEQQEYHWVRFPICWKPARRTDYVVCSSCS